MYFVWVDKKKVFNGDALKTFCSIQIKNLNLLFYFFSAGAGVAAGAGVVVDGVAVFVADAADGAEVVVDGVAAFVSAAGKLGT